MMITRFNADSKSKIKFTAGERLAIGAASMMGISHRAAKEAVDVSRTYYYELGQKVEPLLEGMTAADEIARSAILVTEEFIERSVTALHTVCNTPESAIQYFMEQVCQVKISKGKLCDILKAAEEKAAAHDAGVSLEGIEVMETDEIFQGNQPILTAVDPVRSIKLTAATPSNAFTSVLSRCSFPELTFAAVFGMIFAAKLKSPFRLSVPDGALIVPLIPLPIPASMPEPA